jgi:single-stranded DNA-binding protein
MKDVNKHEITGTVVGEPKFSEGSVAKLIFKVQTIAKWEDKDGMEHESKQTHNVVCWRDLATENKERIKKEMRVSLVGPRINSVSEKDGKKAFFTETRADELSVVMD